MYRIHAFIPRYLMGLLLFGSLSLRAQSPLDVYIDSAFARNLVLQQRGIEVQKASLALESARSLYLPSVNLSAGFLSGAGGRYINLPVGDLLNPVYGTLNQLTQTQNFPQIENVRQSFLPNQQLDAHLRTSAPLINSDIRHGKKLSEQQLRLKEYEIDLYKRELVQDIKVAYYNYQMALAARSIYDSALRLVGKNVDINESLLRNGKGLPAQVLRARSEYEQVRSQLNAADNQLKNARNYFNFLLNRDLEATIEADTLLPRADLLQAGQAAGQREEIALLQQGRALLHTQTLMYQDYWKPKLNAFLDLGNQFEQWNVSSKAWYYLFGLQVDMPIFNGHRNQKKIQVSRLEEQAARLRQEEAERGIALQVSHAGNELQTQWTNYQSATEQVKAAQSYFYLVEKGFQEGIHSLIEYIDARNQMTQALIQQNIQRFRVFQAEAMLERERASYPLNH